MSPDNDRWIEDLRGDGAKRESALGELRVALVRSLHKALVGRGADDAFVEDAVQDALVRILDRLDQFEGRSRFLTWATAIAIRVAMGELRRRRWKDVSLHDVLEDADFAPPRSTRAQPTPDAQAERQAMLDSMRQMIDSQLTDKQRTALLSELKGMPQDEIARHLGSNRNAIYKLTHDARKKLKQGLEAAGYTAADVAATTAS